MRYLFLTKTGIWHFRFQIPPNHRHLFENRREIKKSLKTSDRESAIISSLELEIEIRKTISNQSSSDQTKSKITPNILPSRKRESSGLTAYDALERFCRYKSDHISTKAVGMLKAKCSTVLELINKSHLKKIRRVDAEEIVLQLRKYPANIKKKSQFTGLSGKESIKLNKSLGLPTLSEESVKDYCQKLSSFFEWCVLNELTDINPFKAIKFKKQRKDSDAKNAYSITDLNKIFSTEIHTQKQFKHPYYFWLPLLGYFTGARLNELCQLYKKDIYIQDGIWVIQINDRFTGQKLKNTASRRVIPIHNKLLDLGFIDFIKSNQHERLFPELKQGRDGFSSAASKWYARFKTKLNFEKGHDFHSFRHTVATQLKRAEVSHVAAGEILGHTQNNITYDRYGKELDISQIQKYINLIDSTVIDN
ncbi:tyrosine-type recombinase/integrase [Vibrio fluvialis]